MQNTRFDPSKVPGLVCWLDATKDTSTREAGQAAQFTAANSETLSIADNAALSTGNVDFMFGGWHYLDTQPAAYIHSICKRSVATNNEYALFYANGSSENRFRAGFWDSLGSTETDIQANSFGAISTATWYFVVAWYNSIAGTINIQVNNGTVDSANFTGGFDSTSAFRLGGSGNVGQYWDGRLQCMFFTKTILSSAQLTTLYNGGVPVAYADLNPLVRNAMIGYWELPEPSGTRIDLAGGNNLTDNNTVTQNQGTCLNSVGTWKDLSGNGLNAVQATAISKFVFRANAINGKPALLADGVDDFMDMVVSSSTVLVQPYTLICVGKLTTASGAAKTIINLTDNVGVTNNFFGLSAASTNTVHQLFFGTLASATANTYTVPHIIFDQVNNASSVMATNGLTDAANVGAGATKALGLAYRASDTIFANYQYGEVIAYTRLLNSMERKKLEKYLGLKWGISTI